MHNTKKTIKKRQIKWKLFWVQIDYVEDTFIVAKTLKSAKSFIKWNEFCGECSDDDFTIELITIIPSSVEEKEIESFQNWSKKHNANRCINFEDLHPWPGYGNNHEFLKNIGAHIREVEDGTEIIFFDTVYLHHISGTYNKYNIGFHDIFEGIPINELDFTEEEFFKLLLKDVNMISHEIEAELKEIFNFKNSYQKRENFYFEHEIYESDLKYTLGQLLNAFKLIIFTNSECDELFTLLIKMRNFISHTIFSTKKFNSKTEYGVKHSISFFSNYLHLAEIVKKLILEFKKHCKTKFEFGKQPNKRVIIKKMNNIIQYYCEPQKIIKYKDYFAQNNNNIK